jgi:hypothetical protein
LSLLALTDLTRFDGVHIGGKFATNYDRAFSLPTILHRAGFET